MGTISYYVSKPFASAHSSSIITKSYGGHGLGLGGGLGGYGTQWAKSGIWAEKSQVGGILYNAVQNVV